uniref:BAR domain-containing protein n=1 Tax=Timema poppense TaxID=170557 RepID=A0A7R9DY53_TIMPO|nr:unnamed protein product [Timema poppensis]
MCVVCLQADATVVMEHRHFVQASLQYVFLLQEVQERKKFEFVETLLGFMYGWLTFYHQGHEVANEFKPYMRELQLKLQKVTVLCLSTLTVTQDRTKMSVPYSCARSVLENLAPVDWIGLDLVFAPTPSLGRKYPHQLSSWPGFLSTGV